MVNFKSIVKNLQKHYPDAAEVAIVNKGGKVLFSTPKWDIKGDIKKFLSSWTSGTAQYVEINGIRFSVLQMAPERFVGTNLHKKGHLVAASTPDGDKYMIAHIRSKAKGSWVHMAYPAIARAAAMMQKGSDSKFIESDVDDTESPSQILSQKVSEQRIIDPILKAEIEGFLGWIRNAGGLPSYLSYSLQQNDPIQIA